MRDGGNKGREEENIRRGKKIKRSRVWRDGLRGEKEEESMERREEKESKGMERWGEGRNRRRRKRRREGDQR